MAASKVYGSSVLPSDVVQIYAGEVSDISLGFNAIVGLIGNMDVTNGTASPGTIKEVSDATNAGTYFGENSELTRQCQIAEAIGVSSIQAVGLPETSESEAANSTQSGTLASSPVDPNVCSEHDITFTDSSSGSDLTTKLVYTDTVSAPSEADTVNVNPNTGDWKADATGSYDINYTSVDWTDAIPAMAGENVRFIGMMTEDVGLQSTMNSELTGKADTFDFKRAVGGAEVNIEDVANYSQNIDSTRIIRSVPSRGYVDGTEVRTAGAVAALYTSVPLGEGAYGFQSGQLDGITGLRTNYPNGDLKTLADEDGLLPITDGPRNVHVAKDMTTSSTSYYNRIYQSEIIDEGAYVSHQVARQYVSEPNLASERTNLRGDIAVVMQEMYRSTPQLLEDYVVKVREATAKKAVVTIGFDPVDMMDVVEVNMHVGEMDSSVEFSTVDSTDNI